MTEYELNNEILNSIDTIEETGLFAEMNVLSSMVDCYTKAAMIVEHCDDTTDMSCFGVFQESVIMEADDPEDSSSTKGKVMKNIWKTIVKIATFIPKMIYKLGKALIGKIKKTSKTTEDIKMRIKNAANSRGVSLKAVDNGKIKLSYNIIHSGDCVVFFEKEFKDLTKTLSDAIFFCEKFIQNGRGTLDDRTLGSLEYFDDMINRVANMARDVKTGLRDTEFTKDDIIKSMETLISFNNSGSLKDFEKLIDSLQRIAASKTTSYYMNKAVGAPTEDKELDNVNYLMKMSKNIQSLLNHITKMWDSIDDIIIDAAQKIDAIDN